jgi:hypothetical protein
MMSSFGGCFPELLLGNKHAGRQEIITLVNGRPMNIEKRQMMVKISTLLSPQKS